MDIPIFQHTFRRNRRELECGLFSIDRVGLPAGFELFKIAVHHRSRATRELHEMRHGASMINMGVRNQHELDVPGIKAKLVDRFLDDFRRAGHASIEQDVSGRRRNQIGGKSLGADIMDGPDDLERLSRLNPAFQIGAQGRRHALLSAQRGADI